jgi:hypothetical protein
MQSNKLKFNKTKRGFKMRYFQLLIVLGVLLIAVPAVAVDDFYGPDEPLTFDQSRRPDLGIGSARGAGTGMMPEKGDSVWEEFYVSDVEIGVFLERLYEVLTNEEWLGQYPEIATVANYMKETGLFDLQNVHTEYAITGDRMSFMLHEDFEDLSPNSYYGKVLALPDRELDTAQYVTGDQLLYFAANNVPDMLLLYANEVMNAVNTMEQTAEGMEMEADLNLGDLAEVFGMLEAFNVEDTVKSLLTGEIAIVFYNMPPLEQLMLGDIQPADIELAIMLGVSNREGVQGMIEGFGDEVGLLAREYEDDPWQYYVVNGEETIGLMLNDGMAIISSNIDVTRRNVLAAEENGGLELDPCQLYCDLNMTALHDQVIVPAVNMGTGYLPEGVTLPVEPMSYLVNLPESDALGHLTVKASFADGYTGEIELKKAVLQYLAYYLGIGLCGAAQSGAFH